jgi:hypothetical protein
LRVPLEDYLRREMTKVYSLVAEVPFTPLDVDLNLLARGEWDTAKDRFRVWSLPRTEGQNEPSCYVTIRKFDPRQGVLVYAHLLMNPGAGVGEDGRPFTVQILSNDDVRARAILGVFLGAPPAFHRRAEITLIEGRWRADPETVVSFAANVRATAVSQGGPGGEVTA